MRKTCETKIMKHIFVFICIISTFFQTYAYESLKLVNGINATEGEFPYAVSVRYNNCHQCGGSIISEKWVLTAAHCIFPDHLDIATILFGTIEIKNCEERDKTITRNVKRAVIHENYEPYDGYFNDIALIEVQDDFVFSNTVQPINLPKQDEISPILQESVLVGWGYPQEDIKVVSPLLQMVNIRIFSDINCMGYFGSNFSQFSHICAGLPQGGTGQCTGDSGGALTVNNTQYGIVSWSDKPCATTPGVLTRVASFINWISEKIQTK